MTYAPLTLKAVKVHVEVGEHPGKSETKATVNQQALLPRLKHRENLPIAGCSCTHRRQKNRPIDKIHTSPPRLEFAKVDVELTPAQIRGCGRQAWVRPGLMSKLRRVKARRGLFFLSKLVLPSIHPKGSKGAQSAPCLGVIRGEFAQ